MSLLPPKIKIDEEFKLDSQCTLYTGDCLSLLKKIPNKEARLIITSPPYNIGKSYEKKTNLETYLKNQEKVIKESVRILADDGSICWQVGNYVNNNEIVPLDIIFYPIFKNLGLKLRNRIIWHFEHGLHSSKRLSGRHETILWFTKSDSYVFNLDQIRVPQKYPNKRYYKGPKKGKLSSNPLGKNPGDVWVIPNVKHNHVEKTIHPCQFPVELIERLVLSMTKQADLVVDPYIGVGTTAVAAIKNKRRAAGADIIEGYIAIAKERVQKASTGLLRTRPMTKPIYSTSKKNLYDANNLVLSFDQAL